LASYFKLWQVINFKKHLRVRRHQIDNSISKKLSKKKSKKSITSQDLSAIAEDNEENGSASSDSASNDSAWTPDLDSIN